MVTRLHAGWLRHCCLTLSRSQRFVCSAKHLRPALLHPPKLLFNEYKQVATWPGHKANHSPPPNAKVKNICSYTSTPTMYIHGTHRNTFTITSNDSLNMSLKFSGSSTKHHSSNAANYKNMSSKFKLQLTISNKNVLLVICELARWLGQHYAVHVC